MATGIDWEAMRRLSDAARPSLIMPRRGPGVCVECFNLTRGYEHCYACEAGAQRLAAVVPISYGVAGEPLHAALAAYKREADPFVPAATAQIAAILWRFLERHEPCVAAAAGVDRFDLITTVPSGERSRDPYHPLRRVVGELVEPARSRHERLLEPPTASAAPRRFDPDRFAAARTLGGEAVLLIDDVWTSGASAQSAAAALLAAGSGPVAAVVIARYLNPGWHQNARRLQRRRGDFEFDSCALCAPESRSLRATRPA
jgi:predicted amidophosphoribosyltransferase